MLYQLPNGKTIYLTVEEYYNLTDEQFQDLVASGYGETPSNPFYGSVIKHPVRESSEEDEELVDHGLDYDVGGDEPDYRGPLDLNNIPDEDSII